MSKLKKRIMSSMLGLLLMLTSMSTVFAQSSVELPKEFIASVGVDDGYSIDIDFIQRIEDAKPITETETRRIYIFVSEEKKEERVNIYSNIEEKDITKITLGGKQIEVVTPDSVREIISSSGETYDTRRFCIHKWVDVGNKYYDVFYTSDASGHCREKIEFIDQECSKCNLSRTKESIYQKFPHRWVSITGGGPHTMSCEECGMRK